LVTFGDQIRMARLRSGLSQDACAVAAGLHRTHLSLIERGPRREMTLDTLVKLSRALGVSPGELLERYAASDDRQGRT
jgi:transcriptional regulator with XRE-family HTH domain